MHIGTIRRAVPQPHHQVTTEWGKMHIEKGPSGGYLVQPLTRSWAYLKLG